MKNVFRSIFLAAATVLLVTSASGPSDAAAQIARASSFDGNWSVVINTLRGDCGSALRYSVRIVGGQVLAADQSYQVAGVVNASGMIRVVVAEAGRSASGAGRLSGNNGGGLWHTSTGECSGQWTAARRNY
jgi:hypothetical protein